VAKPIDNLHTPTLQATAAKATNTLARATIALARIGGTGNYHEPPNQPGEESLIHQAISGQDLKDARSRIKMSQREFAQLLGHGQRTVVTWEPNGVPDGNTTAYPTRRCPSYEHG
jgi:DNA-binding XRE family transcriptional regulator